MLNPPPPAVAHLFTAALTICPLLFRPSVVNITDGRVIAS